MCASKALNPRLSAELIMRHAKDVKIQDDGIKRSAGIVFDALFSGKISPTRFTEAEQHPREATESSVDWIFLVDTLNFSFWTDANAAKWEVAYGGKVHTGYFALCAAVNRAIDEGLNVTDPRVFGALTPDDLRRIFRSEADASIPLIEQRLENLREASRVLLEKYQGTFVNCVKASGQSAQRLLHLIVSDFPSYRDEGLFQGTPVSFWKRAQILVGDVWACFEGKGLGYFPDIDSLAMFPDYRIPQVLLHFGALKYSPELYGRLENDELLESGCVEEMEIRGASIHAVELIKGKVKVLLEEAAEVAGDDTASKGRIPSPDAVNSILIDHFLWDYRRDNVEELDRFPFHKVRCIYY